jgi:hypothetical protein
MTRALPAPPRNVESIILYLADVDERIPYPPLNGRNGRRCQVVAGMTDSTKPRNHRHSPVSVKADQKNGSEES